MRNPIAVLAVLSGYIVSSGYGIVAEIHRTLVRSGTAGRDISIHTVRWRWRRYGAAMASAPHPHPSGETMMTPDGQEVLITTAVASVDAWFEWTAAQAAESGRARMEHARAFRWDMSSPAPGASAERTIVPPPPPVPSI